MSSSNAVGSHLPGLSRNVLLSASPASSESGPVSFPAGRISYIVRLKKGYRFEAVERTDDSCNVMVDHATQFRIASKRLEAWQSLLLCISKSSTQRLKEAIITYTIDVQGAYAGMTPYLVDGAGGQRH